MVVLTPPVSKSDAQRALVLADVLGLDLDTVVPPHEVLPRDVRVLRAGLLALRAATADLDCHDGGAPFRFLVTQAAVQPGRVVRFTGTPRLGERPHGPLLDALERTLGPILERGSPWPLVVRSPARLEGPYEFTVTGEESSQFASSLLLGAARLSRSTGAPCAVRVEGALTSEGYLAMTVRWLERAGFRVAPGFVVSAPERATPLPPVPGDWSSLGYLLLLAWKAGASVARVDLTAEHPDALVVSHLASVGLVLRDGRVVGTPTGGLDVDAQACPDAVPTLAALAAVLPAPSVFRRTGILRHKESDRLDGTRALLAAAGVATSLEGDALRVTPGPVRAFDFDARDDHRLAMSAAVLAFLGGVPLRLEGKAAVAKSFPSFWDEAAKVGLSVEALP